MIFFTSNSTMNSCTLINLLQWMVSVCHWSMPQSWTQAITIQGLWKIWEAPCLADHSSFWFPKHSSKTCDTGFKIHALVHIVSWILYSFSFSAVSRYLSILHILHLSIQTLQWVQCSNQETKILTFLYNFHYKVCRISHKKWINRLRPYFL